jgi:hypothetical protein
LVVRGELTAPLFQELDNELTDATLLLVLAEFSDLKFEIGSSENPVTGEKGFRLSPGLLDKLLPPRGPLSKRDCADTAKGLLSLGLG